MDLSSINYWAVIVAAATSFIIGAVWYSPSIFGKIWMDENKLTKQDLGLVNMSKIFSGAFVLNLIIALNLAAFLGSKQDFVWGMTAGALAGIGWVAASFGVIYLFEQKSIRLYLINAGYLAFVFIVMGGILGYWK